MIKQKNKWLPSKIILCFSNYISAVNAHLFENEEIEEDHAEVVHNECLSELKWFTVFHVLGPQP